MAVDMLGCLAMIALATKCLVTAYKIYQSDTGDILANYLLWLIMAIFAFSVSRSFGHILKHILHFAGYIFIWDDISPVSGSINTITFVLIASITMFFGKVQIIMEKISQNRVKIKKQARSCYS